MIKFENQQACINSVISCIFSNAKFVGWLSSSVMSNSMLFFWVLLLLILGLSQLFMLKF